MLSAREYEQILASVSHEIRNPVALINSYLQLLKTDCPGVCASPYWEIIQSEMAHLKLLLRDISAYQNGIRLQRAPVDMEAWLREYTHALAPLLKQYPSVAFDCRIAPGLPALSVDASKLRQVLDNLVRNALEALSGDAVLPNMVVPGCDLALSLHAYGQGGYLYICVLDNGCGIPAEQADTLFDPFVTHKSGGSGLGLAICRRIMEAHGGTVRCTSLKNPTEFRLALPEEIPR